MPEGAETECCVPLRSSLSFGPFLKNALVHFGVKFHAAHIEANLPDGTLKVDPRILVGSCHVPAPILLLLGQPASLFAFAADALGQLLWVQFPILVFHLANPPCLSCGFGHRAARFIHSVRGFPPKINELQLIITNSPAKNMTKRRGLRENLKKRSEFLASPEK